MNRSIPESDIQALLVLADLRGASVGQLARLGYSHLSERRGRDRIYTMLADKLVRPHTLPGSARSLVTLGASAYRLCAPLRQRLPRHVFMQTTEQLLLRGYLKAALRIALIDDGFEVGHCEKAHRVLLDDLCRRQAHAALTASPHVRFLKENTLRTLQAQTPVALDVDVAWRGNDVWLCFVEHPHRALRHQLATVLPTLPECEPIRVIPRAVDHTSVFDLLTQRFTYQGVRQRRLNAFCRSTDGPPVTVVDYPKALALRQVNTQKGEAR